MRFAKDFLSNGKADQSNNPSFKSCLLRIPNSINSKNNTVVKIVQRWNEYSRPTITKELLLDFRRYLIQKKIDQYNYRQRQTQKQKRNYNYSYLKNNNHTCYYYEWIEQILQTSFEDCRKIIVDLILAPYLINIKKLSYQESYRIIRKWLDKCDTLKELDSCKFDSRIAYALKIASNKRIGPMSLYRIKTGSKYSNLYLLLLQK